MNIATIMGRLTRDPELRQTKNGTSTVSFTVAVDRPTREENGEKKADFISCVAWNKTAEFICQYFRKGDGIIITGSQRTGSYTDRNHSDVTHYTCDTWVDRVYFPLGKSGNSTQNTQNAQNTQNTQNAQNTQSRSLDMSDFQEATGATLPF